jgi:hypothetical protein
MLGPDSNMQAMAATTHGDPTTVTVVPVDTGIDCFKY